jgi:hypothetical protein
MKFQVAEHCFTRCSAALPYPASARIRSAFELALGFKQLRPSQARHWPRAHFCLQAGSQGMLEVATRKSSFGHKLKSKDAAFNNYLILFGHLP